MPGEKVLVGYVPDRRGADALALGASAAAGGGRLLLGHVRPPAWPARGPGSVDAEWERYLRDRAAEALAEGVALAKARGLAAEPLPPGEDRASGKGLARLAEGAGASAIVIGSAPGGSRTCISLGSTADQLLHGSHLPVLIAPKGYAGRGLAGFDRVTAAYVRRPGAMAAVEAAALIAVRHGAPLRLLTFAVGPAARGKAAALAEDQLHRLVEALESDLAEAVRETVRTGALRKREILTEVATGWDAAHAVSGAGWTEGELLVCSSSETGPLRRVFMGDMSMKIIRAAPCPVMIVPRGIR
ncbi:universal stress protein [Actinocorallia populi]|uniref:universal stress protein n=1 Tax=Actinocorallia populi TaxID=2079200 RepID=UPI000D08A579|nr:universal stress protein [Actinocorallia populi]